MMPEPMRRAYRVEEVAEMYGLSQEAVRSRIRRGLLGAMRTPWTFRRQKWSK